MKLTKSVWLTESANKYVDLNDIRKPEESTWFTYCDIDTDMSKYGCTLIGTAEIEITMLDQSVITANAIDAIKNQIQSVRAESENKITKLQDQINKLLAISNEV